MMKPYLFIAGLLLLQSPALRAAEFQPALEHAGKPVPGFRIFRSGDMPMLYLNADYGQFGSGIIRFPEKQPAGVYSIRLTVAAPEEKPAAVGFYLLLESGKHLMLRERQNAVPGRAEQVRFSGESPEPAIGFVMKKMEPHKRASVAVGGISIGVEPKAELPEIPFREGHAESFRIAGLGVKPSELVEAGDFAGVGLSAERNRFTWSTLKLDRVMPAGNYDFSGRILVPSPEAADAALYALGGDGSHAPIGGTLHPGEKSGVSERRFSFVAAAPFSAILVKKMTGRKTASVALGDFTLTMRPELRLAASNEVMRYPAPFGIRSETLAAEVGAAVASGKTDAVRKLIPETEAWLDAASLAADAAAELRLLRLAADAFAEGRFHAELDALEQDFRKIRTLLRDRNSPEAGKRSRDLKAKLSAFRAALNRAAGGEADPDYGSDIYAWVKNFEAATGKRTPEFEEPTPYRIPGPDGFVLRFRKPGDAGEFESGRVTNRYFYEDADFTFSALTGVMAVDMKKELLTGEIVGKGLRSERISGNVFQIRGEGEWALLILCGGRIGKADVENGTLTIRTAKPGRIGLLFTRRWNLKEAAAYYAPRLDRLPAEVVQVERNGEIEQRVLDRNGGVPAFFPVSPLLKSGMAAPVPVRVSAAFAETPDGYTVLAGEANQALRYRLPERRIRMERGVNVFDKPGHTPELYRELKSQGCEVIRLACGTETRWDWSKPEIMRDALVHNLKLIEEAGMKTGIDLHGGWTPGAEFGAFDSAGYRAEFMKRWRQIIEWAEPFRKSVAWYDLMNEPRIFREQRPVEPYWKLIASVLPELRKSDPDTPFLVEVANMANPIGAWDWQPQEDRNVILGYHDYWPHMFTHQKVPDGGSAGMADVHYPGFMPMITWDAPSWRNDNRYWMYWDRWKVEAVSYPVLRILAASGMPGDCGELGVVGYAGRAGNSGRIWLADAIRRMERIGISYSVWGVNGGYVWNVPQFREEVLNHWKKRRGR